MTCQRINPYLIYTAIRKQFALLALNKNALAVKQKVLSGAFV